MKKSQIWFIFGMALLALARIGFLAENRASLNPENMHDGNAILICAATFFVGAFFLEAKWRTFYRIPTVMMALSVVMIGFVDVVYVTSEGGVLNHIGNPIQWLIIGSVLVCGWATIERFKELGWA